jgi:hypothetical protein
MSQGGVLSEKATAVLSQFPAPVRIHPSRWKVLTFFILPIAGCGSFAIWSTLPVWPRLNLQGQLVMGGVNGFVIVAAAALTAMFLVKRLPRITLDADGIAFHSLLFVSKKRWTDVSRFVSRIVYVGYADTSRPAGYWEKLFRFGSFGRMTFFNIFDVGGTDLCRLLGAWRERALTQSTEPKPYGSSSIS